MGISFLIHFGEKLNQIWILPFIHFRKNHPPEMKRGGLLLPDNPSLHRLLGSLAFFIDKGQDHPQSAIGRNRSFSAKPNTTRADADDLPLNGVDTVALLINKEGGGGIHFNGEHSRLL